MPGIRRAQTFDVVTPRRAGPAVEYYDYGPDDYYDDDVYDRYASSDRRRSHDDGHSRTSSHRSYRSRRSHRHRSASQSRPALTESNLRTHSEVSTTGPPAAAKVYRSPYAETAPRDTALSRPSLYHAATASAISQQLNHAAVAPSSYTGSASPVSTPRQSMLVHRPRSEATVNKKSKEIDLNLAYGNIPPDLASRVDLDVCHEDEQDNLSPAWESPVAYQGEEQEARTLMARIEAFLDEAHCLHHSATAIIAHLQGNPEAAAAVALTLAELSALLGKLSPAFLTVVKGGSPAVFALLASPQFLIAAGVAVGVTVVMFGGWKIVKRIREAKKEREDAMAFEAQQQGNPDHAPYEPFAPAAVYGVAGSGFDEALVLEEELSTIESWRRGIVPFGEDESADMELISPEAERRRREDKGDDIAPDDSASRSGRTEKSSRSHRTSKTTQRSGHSHHRSSLRHKAGDQDYIPERKSSKGFKTREGADNESERSGSHRSHKSSRSNKTEKTAVKAIEGSSKDTGNTLDVVLQKGKKPNMLKTLFKKKKEREDNDRAGVSVLV